MSVNPRKAGIIGCGQVGASIAFRFLQQGLFTELVLLDANREKAQGEAMDLSDGLPYASPMSIRAGSYEDLSDCALVVLAAGASQREGENRLSLVGRNMAILRSVLEQLTARPFYGILLVVSNPVDVLTYAAGVLSGLPAHRVFGSGTVLDTGRLKQLLGMELEVDSRNVHAFIIGEHGDSELALWSGANVSGMDLDHFRRLSRQRREALDRQVRSSAYEIIRRKGATCYGVAMAVGRIAAAIVRDEHTILPVSVLLDGPYGLHNLSLSVPAMVGRSGIERIPEVPLSSDEQAALAASAQRMQAVIRSLEL